MDNSENLPDMPPEERERLLAAMMRMMELGVGVVYGDEGPGVPDASLDCSERVKECKSRCCTLNFALTKDEVAEGVISHNTRRPFFIARDADGYCPHMDRQTYACTVYDQRPLRCRRYDCTVEG